MEAISVRAVRPDLCTYLGFYQGIVDDPHRMEALRDIRNALAAFGFGKPVHTAHRRTTPRAPQTSCSNSRWVHYSSVNRTRRTSTMSRQVRYIRLMSSFSSMASSRCSHGQAGGLPDA